MERQTDRYVLSLPGGVQGICHRAPLPAAEPDVCERGVKKGRTIAREPVFAKGKGNEGQRSLARAGEMPGVPSLWCRVETFSI